MFRRIFPFLLLGSLSFSLTLREAVNLAEKNYPALKAKLEDYKAAQNAYYAQIAQRFGQVTLFYNYNRYKTPRIVAPISPQDFFLHTIPSDDQVRIYGFKYTVRLFDGCQQFFIIRAKGKQADLAKLEYLDSIAKTALEVKNLYFQILALKAQRRALLERKKAVDELYRIVKTAYEMGKKSVLDFLNIAAERKSVGAQIKNISYQIDELKRKLAVLTGLKNASFKVEPVEVRPKPVSAVKLLPTLMSKNYQLRETSLQKGVADEYKRAALAEFSPKIDFSYSRSWYRYDSSTRSDWQYTVAVTLPLFDFGLRFFNYRRAAALERKALQARKLTRKTVLQEFYSTVENLNTLIDVLDAQRSRLKFAKRAYEVEKKKYLLGKSDVYNLLKAEALYFTAKGDYEALKYRWAALKAKLDYLLGY